MKLQQSAAVNESRCKIFSDNAAMTLMHIMTGWLFDTNADNLKGANLKETFFILYYSAPHFETVGLRAIIWA